MRELVDFLGANDVYFVLGLIALVLILLIDAISLSRKVTRLARRRNNRLEDGHVADIVECLNGQSDLIERMRNSNEEIAARQTTLDGELAKCLNRIGLVRFNAFEDVGGEQSFALAMLDINGNGVVVSSLYGRHEARLYAKGIMHGEGERPLSDEERNAVDKALGAK